MNQLDPRVQQLQALWDASMVFLADLAHRALPYAGMVLVLVLLIAVCLCTRTERAPAARHG